MNPAVMDQDGEEQDVSNPVIKRYPKRIPHNMAI
jgi:hypothetical protein